MRLLFLGIVAWQQGGLGIKLRVYVKAWGDKEKLFFMSVHVAASTVQRSLSSNLCS